MKYVEYKLDKVRKFCLDMKAFLKIEEKLNVKFAKINFEELSFHEMLTVITCGLQHEDPELTIELVGDLIDQYSDIFTAYEVIGEGIEKAYGKPKNATGVKNPKK